MVAHFRPLMAMGNLSIARLWSGRALLMAFQGYGVPCFADRFLLSSLPCWFFQQGFFAHKILCARQGRG